MMMKKKYLSLVITSLFLGLPFTEAHAITLVDNFTGSSSNAGLDWATPAAPDSDTNTNDACLTAGNSDSKTNGGIPSCASIISSTPGTSFNANLNQSQGNGALLLTTTQNSQEGAIISQKPFNTSGGLTVTFNTYTFGGAASGGGGPTNLFNASEYGITPISPAINTTTGADGIGFYLIDATNPLVENQSNGQPDGTLASTFSIGGNGGSGAYQCSNTNYPYNGMPGAYLGLGIDEWGNFVNPNDNTDSGPGFAPNSLGMRGYGNVNQAAIAQEIDVPTQDISSSDVQNYCKNGNITYNNNTYANLPDYQYIDGSFAQLPANELISDPTAQTRSAAHPMSYKLTITPTGLLSFSYSYNNGAYQQVINQQPINANGQPPLPPELLFGFGASTGGSFNYHEITCFEAKPAGQSSSSASVNVQQTGEVKTNTQVFLAYYNPNNWTGRLTAQYLTVNSTTGAVSVDPVAQWDASCVLTGGVCASTGGTTVTAQPWENIPALTFNGLSGTSSAGVPFTWGSLSSAEQGWLNGDGTSTPYGFGQQLVHYLKGDANLTYASSSFQASSTTPSFRKRTSILGDIINSSPTWVGGPDEGLPGAFSNVLYPTVASTLNSEIGSNTYPAFATNEAGRNNVVYVGANDGMLHGFQAGAYNGTGGSFNSSTNNGQEVLAYVPYAVLQSFNSEINTGYDYAYPGYGHNYYVNATPDVGSAFYNGNWHTLLVGGLGTGGRGLYALNITHPSQFSANDTGAVLADYTFANPGNVPGNATAPTPPGWVGENVTGTNSYQDTMGNVSGKPIIRLMNNGDYAVISGNGTGSVDGEAGIFIFLINPTSGFSKTLFLGTGTGSSSASDGIDYVSSADLNGDHFVDYLYAGDTDGNVWRFNVTGDHSSDWHVSYFGNGTTPTALFSAGTSQPITTKILVDTNIAPNGSPQVMLQFGTGNTVPLTNTSGATYATSPQAIYDIWDGGMSGWNTMNTSNGGIQYNAWPSGTPLPLEPGNLVSNSISDTGVASNGDAAVNISSNTVCWAGSSDACNGSNAQYGSMLPLPSVTPSSTTSSTTNSTPLYQQVTYNPAFIEGAAVFDTTIPPYINALTCTNNVQTGFTYALNPLTGGAIANGFFRSSGNNGAAVTLAGVPVSGLQLDATGSPTVVSANGHPVMVQQTVSGNPVATEVFPAGGMGSQVNWIQLR